MANELFFVPIFLNTLRAADPERGLSAAFASIVQKSEQPDFEQGAAQFQAWMDLAVQDETLGAEVWKALLMPDEAGFVLLRDGVIAEQVTLSLTEGLAVMDRIVPGHYELALETGWLIWEAELTVEDLLWTEVHPDEPLAWAASSETRQERPTRTFDLKETGLILNIYPGLEDGRLELSANKCEEES